VEGEMQGPLPREATDAQVVDVAANVAKQRLGAIRYSEKPGRASGRQSDEDRRQIKAKRERARATEEERMQQDLINKAGADLVRKAFADLRWSAGLNID